MTFSLDLINNNIETHKEQNAQINYQNNMLVMPDTDAEILFETIYESLKKLNSTIANNWQQKLLDQVDSGEITIQEACIKLREVMDKRLNIERTGFSDKNKNLTKVDKLIQEDLEIDIMDINHSLAIPDNFLGNGSVANVAKLVKRPGFCVKVVHDLKRYYEDNLIHTESDILAKLNNFSISGVRTPKAFYSISTLDTIALIMEELDAACLIRVIEKKDTLPENFNLEDYFSRLEKYLSALHEKGIYHLDFVARNLMVDRKTGLPYVIDFGKSKTKNDIIGEKFDVWDGIYREKDKAGLQSAKQKIHEFLNK